MTRILITAAVGCALSGLLGYLLLPVLREFRARHPGVHLRISNHSTPRVIAAARGLHRQTQGPSAQRRRPGAGADAADRRRGTMRVRRGAPCGFCDTIKSRRALVY